MTQQLAFIDTETTGLSPFMHEVWEIAVILAKDTGSELRVDEEITFMIPLTEHGLAQAESEALKVGKFWQRHPSADVLPSRDKRNLLRGRQDAARALSRMLEGRIFVANNPHFDASMLSAFLVTEGHPYQPWFYQVCDIKTAVAGRLGFKPPYKSSEIFNAIGWVFPEGKQHEALEDARSVVFMYDWLYYGAGRKFKIVNEEEL